MIAGCQIRAARSLLYISTQQLADLAGVSKLTVVRMEKRRRLPIKGRTEILMKVKKALETQGIEFVFAANGNGEGVIFKKPFETDDD